MAEALISVILDQLLSITKEFTIQEFTLVKDVQKNILSLKSKFEAIQVVLEDAEKQQLTNACVRRWLDQLKLVSYDIDNVLEEWSTEILVSKIHQKHNALLVSKNKKKKVRFPLTSSCFCHTQLKQVGIRREIAVKFKKLNDKLDGIEKERRDYSFETTKVVPSKRRETTSFVDVSKVYGRDVDKNYLMSKLLCDSSCHGGEGPVIIPIVGMGGIGKTTLAQLAFDDDKVKANFNVQVWVSVSDPFDEIGIAKATLQELNVSIQNLHTLQALFHTIHESIEGKKFLLVLDDVWIDDREKWEQFIQPFRSGAAGSKLLVTTRKNKVAIMMGVATQNIIQLELLSEEHCWSIFSQLAFF
ncbi:hypothetical protein FNV43_RR13525 [Rhamnella rubrinervis]|uniref:P-loop containing nucleoside triphosphate hydrolase n=1 Tax=Rhamnella rubrinervis TaxID=2594499 RepID=A0A8K0H1E7_9ROSA|nr:hypothetical protein FNV43_RR13525 [Rhamnella rubrinervis]